MSETDWVGDFIGGIESGPGWHERVAVAADLRGFERCRKAALEISDGVVMDHHDATELQRLLRELKP